MSKPVSSLAVAFAALCTFAFSASAALASTSGVVISQVYGGGGNSGATYTNDFIELFNAGNSAVDISGWSVQYTSSSGDSWSSNLSTIPSGSSALLQPGQYYLIQEKVGSGGTEALPTPDFDDGTIGLSGSKGKVALVNNSTPLTKVDCPTDASIVDFVGFGSANCSEGNNPTDSLSNSTAAIRADSGCTDTDDNHNDFAVDAPTPRNSSDNHLCPSSNNITVSMKDVGHDEGNTGTTTPFVFKVKLSKPAPTGGVTFDVATADGTGTDGATAPSDYTAIPTSAASIPAGATSVGVPVTINGDDTPEPNETFTLTASNIQLGTPVSGVNITPSVTATGTIYNDDATDAAIWEIQASSAASPMDGKLVHTCGIVTVVGPNGFYLQSSTNNEADATCNTDGNPQTSDGVYVYSSASVTPGDLIDFDAEVSEYHGLTELSFVTNLQTTSQGNALPPAVVFDDTTPSPDPTALSCTDVETDSSKPVVDTNFECFESMLVTIDNGFVTTGSGKASGHTYDYFYATATGKRALREPGLLYGLTRTAGDNDASPIWDGNPEEFEVLPNEFPGINDDTKAINGGSTFTATGVIGYNFGSYVLYPTTLDVNYALMPRAVPMADPGILRIGEFNVERFCDDVNDKANGTEVFQCDTRNRKDYVPSPAEYDTKAQRIADYIGTVLALPDVVAIEEVENIGALTKLADDINTTYGLQYTAKLDEGNDPSGIDVGYLINEARVHIDSITQLDKDLVWTTPNDNVHNIFDHPPLLLKGTFVGGGQNQPFNLMVNHLKARQNVDDVNSSGNSTADAKEDQEKRFRQAVAVALQVQTLQLSGSPQPNAQPAFLGITPHAITVPTPLILVGDFNAYQFTDGFANTVGMISGLYNFDANIWDLSDLTTWNLDTLNPPFTDNNLVNPPLWNAVDSLPGNERYSYLYAPNLGFIQGYGEGGDPRDTRRPPTDQVLDHALLNTDARRYFLRMDYGRANLDAATADEETAADPATLGPIGVSDHDGFVLQMVFDRIFANGFENKH